MAFSAFSLCRGLQLTDAALILRQAAHYYPRSPREDWVTVTGPGTVGPTWKGEGPGYHAPPGWVSGAGHGTFDESFAQEIPFSTSLYEIHQLELTRTKFTVVAESARAQRGGGSGSSSGATVIPYLSLGAGFHPNTSFTDAYSVGGTFLNRTVGFPIKNNGADFPFAAVCYDVGFDPDLSFSAAMGAQINQGGRTFNSTGYFSAQGPWELAGGAIFFPSVFEDSCASDSANHGAGGCVQSSTRLPGSTNIFDHFLAYVSGAHGDYTTAPA